MATRLLPSAFLLFAFAAGVGAANAGEVNPFGGLIVPPIDWSTQKPGKTGDVKDGELKHPETKEVITRYRAFVPEKLPTEKHLALLICFHGRGGSENGPADHMARSIKALGLDQQYVVLGLKAQNEGWEDVDEAPVLKAYEWATTVYPIDKRRVYLVGHSSGAHWDTRFGAKHQHLIAGIMRWAGGSVRLPSFGKDMGPLMTEWYLVHGTKDDQNSITNTREGRDHLKAAGYRYVLREILDGDHNDIVRHPLVTIDMIHWMDALRHKTMPLPADDEKYLKQFANAKVAAKLFADADTWNELLRIGGPHAGQVVAEAFKSDKTKVREFAALACTKSRFAGDDTVAGLAKLMDDKIASVRQAAITALGIHSNWRSEAAQLALGRLALSAKSKKVEFSDRGEATMQLARAATLPLLGNFDDDLALWQALMALMNDERLELRSAAFAPLKATVPDGNGYDPSVTAAERAGALAKWESWFQTRMVSAANKQAKK